MRRILLIIISTYSISAFTQKTAVQFDKGSVAYLGLVHPLTILVENISCEDILVYSSHNKIVRDSIDKCKFGYLPKIIGYDTLSIYRKNKKNDMIFLDKRIIAVKEINFLDAYIVGAIDSKIDKKYLIDFPKRFRMTMLNSMLDLYHPIDSFSVCIKRQGKFIHTGNYIMKEDLSDLYVLLSLLEIGDELIFFDVYYFAFECNHKCAFYKYTII